MGAGFGAGESWAEFDSDLGRVVAFLAALSGEDSNYISQPPFAVRALGSPDMRCEPLGFPCVIQLTSKLWICSILVLSHHGVLDNSYRPRKAPHEIAWSSGSMSRMCKSIERCGNAPLRQPRAERPESKKCINPAVAVRGSKA